MTRRNTLFLLLGMVLGTALTLCLLLPSRSRVVLHLFPDGSNKPPKVTIEDDRHFQFAPTEDLRVHFERLARQAGLRAVVSDRVQGTITIDGLTNLTPRDRIQVLATSQSLIVDEINGVLYIKTADEFAPSPTESKAPQP